MEQLRFLFRHPLARQNKIRTLARMIDWQVRARLSDELIVPWIAGARLAARRGMTGATGNIYAGLHEVADMAFVLHFLQRGDLFVDAGANVGSYTVLASRVCGARTIAFEPDPGTVQALRRNIEVNGIEHLAEVREEALGPEAGEVRFTVGGDTVNRVSDDPGEQTRRVPQVTLDAALGKDVPALIKFDLEGYEEAALTGAREVLANPGLAAVEIETVSPASHEMLTGAGLVRQYYDPFTRRLSAAPVDIAASNALYVRNPETVASRVRGATPISVLGRMI